MDKIEIKGYKSFKDLKLELKPINILIGANGSGKSNFLSFFEFLNRLYEQKLTEYVALGGGIDKYFFQGSKVTDAIYAKIDFVDNFYLFELKEGDNRFVVSQEGLGYHNNYYDIAQFRNEANIKPYDGLLRGSYIKKYLSEIKKYHFHDTGKSSPFTKESHIVNDVYYLYEKGENIAAFLYAIRQNEPVVYKRIVRVIQSIAPYFSAINRYRHYTSLRSLKALLATNSAEPPRFRLSNVASMNDSAEGDPLIQLLHQRKENKDEQALCKPNQNKHEEKTDFHTVLQRFGLHAGCPSGLSGLRNVYITSLCSATDYIYMWAIYADKGAGCNLLFVEHFFDIKQSPTPGFVPYFEEASSYPLYRIEYVTENDDGTVTLQTESASGSQSASLSELIDALSDKLYDIDNLLNDDPSDTDMSIRHRITNMLDQVRYLFKYDEYASEQEVRCIVVTASHKLDESKEGIPYLYTEIEKDIEFDEVCLGPKAVQIPETEAWLYATGRVKQVTHSKRHYR